ncbi:MAG: M1 family metallopeptidase [Rhodothermaceae bacterium]
MKIKKLIYLFCLFTIPLLSQESAAKTLSPQNANYDISVKLNPETKMLTATEKLHWKNITSVPVKELQFHLYLNAFKNSKSTFMIESGMRHRGFSSEKDSAAWGWIDIDYIALEVGVNLTQAIEFIHPDDDNLYDRTVIRIPLEKEIKPNQEITLNIKFTAKLPQIMARTGFSDDYFLVGQWFPKIGVFEDKGQRGREEAGWNCHQFHANTEFYADFGNYNVDITIPEKFVVGATGVLQEETKNSDGTKTLKYKAEDVVDFAWTASPLFEVVKDKWKDVDITLLIQPQHISKAENHIQAAKYAFEYFDEKLGKYPYPSMTIVDPPFRGLASAGMEYPMFITAGCIWGMPDGIRTTEMVTIHELGHNYFMGLLASNEFEEAWIDEGFNTHFENRIMDKYYGKKHSFTDFAGFHLGDMEMSRSGYVGMQNPYIAEINRPAWLFKDGGYGTLSYNKPAIVLATFENIVTEETMDKIMKIFFERWKFKHPGGQDFIDIAKEIVEQNPELKNRIDVTQYFCQTLNTSDICDYKVSSIDITENKDEIELSGIDDEKQFHSSEPEDDINYISKVVITRIGDVVVPQELLIQFEDGSEIKEQWNGVERIKVFKYKNPQKIKWVKLDPENKILIDMNLINNSLTLEPETGVVWKYAAKMLFWVQNTMVTMFF